MRGTGRRMAGHWQAFAVGIVALMTVAACTGTATDSADGASDPGVEDTAATGGDTDQLSEETLVPEISYLGSSASSNQGAFDADELLISNWEQLGLRVDHQTAPDYPTWAGLQTDSPTDVASGDWTANLERFDPDNLLSRISCDFIGAQTNWGEYCWEEYENVFQAQRQAVDVEERQELVYRAQELVALDVPFSVHFSSSAPMIWNQEAYEDVVYIPGVGLDNFWNYVDAVPLVEDRTLRIGYNSPWESINPMSAENVQLDTYLQWLIYDSLLEVSPSAEPVPWLAESWEATSDTSFTVHLRDDVTFHDGEPVTAEDVAFSFEYVKEWEVGVYLSQLANFESAEVVDDHTVVLNLSEPTATFISGAMSYVPILPEHIWGNIVEEEGLTHPGDWDEQDMIASGGAVGSGPYMVESIAPAEAIVFSANPDHFHPPQSDQMVNVLYADDDGIYQGMQAGEVYFHQADHMGAAAIADAQQDPRFGFLEEPGIGVSWFSFSFLEDSPFRDWHLRNALVHAQDHQTVLDVIMQGHAGRGEGAVAPANEFWHNDEIPVGEAEGPHWHEFDMERARQLLQEAGYRWDEEGLLHYPENHEPQLHYEGPGL